MVYLLGGNLLGVIYWAVYLRVSQPGSFNLIALLSIVAAVLIAFLPAGIIISMVFSLWIAARKMKKFNVAVKDLRILEMLGSASVCLFNLIEE